MRNPDPEKLNALMGKLVGDLGAALTGALVLLGDRLGIYKAMADGAPRTAKDVARKTKLKERYVREWLSAQAAAGLVDYDAASERFSLSPEQSMALAQEGSPAFFAGAFQVAQSVWLDEPKVAKAFKSGKGVGWHEHSPCLFAGTERFFRPGYNMHLVNSWIPALDGVEEKLKSGAVVADVGCGHGASTILMAKSFPASTFVGSDYHEGSITTARQRAAEAGVSDRVRFEVASASSFSGRGYDLVTMFDCLHDMGDPVGAARHVRQALAPDGTWMIVEPIAGDRVEDNFNPIGRLFYGFSTLLCTPASLSQDVGLALGGQAGESRIRDVVTSAGLTRFRRASETLINAVYEARP